MFPCSAAVETSYTVLPCALVLVYRMNGHIDSVSYTQLRSCSPAAKTKALQAAVTISSRYCVVYSGRTFYPEMDQVRACLYLTALDLLI